MCAAGSILFKDWNMQFFCENENPKCLMMDFGLVKSKLVGLRKEINDIAHLHQICQFMDSCLDDWQQYISSQRDKHYHLNHFTTTQLVMLRNEIAKLCGDSTDNPSIFIYPMLECVRRNCGRHELMAALTAMFGELERKERESEEKEDGVMDEVKEREVTPDGTRTEEDFITTLQQEGFSTGLAREALKHFTTDQLEEGENDLFYVIPCFIHTKLIWNVP